MALPTIKAWPHKSFRGQRSESSRLERSSELSTKPRQRPNRVFREPLAPSCVPKAYTLTSSPIGKRLTRLMASRALSPNSVGQNNNSQPKIYALPNSKRKFVDSEGEPSEPKPSSICKKKFRKSWGSLWTRK